MKDVKGYEGRYYISENGDVFNSSHKALKQSFDTAGYKKVCLSKNGVRKVYRVHQLMAMAFLNHEPCGLKVVIDHIDGDKLNNHISNLRLVSNRENISKGKFGKSKYTGVTICNKSGRYISKIQLNGKRIYLGSFESEEDARDAYLNKLNN